MTRSLVLLDDPPYGNGRSYNALLGGLLALGGMVLCAR